MKQLSFLFFSVPFVFLFQCANNSVPSCDSDVVEVVDGTRSGALTKSETWSNTILITGDIDLGKNCVLTIKPGTVVKFAANSDDRSSGENSSIPISDDYFPNDPPKKPSEMSGIRLYGGNLIAVGTTESPIIFTSNSASPIAGDWHSIQTHTSDSSVTLQRVTI